MERRYEIGEVITVPETVDGERVTSLSAREFSNDEISPVLRSITLPDGLTSIGDYCFYQCRNLRSISLGGGHISIGSDAFMNCSSLKMLRFRCSSDTPTALRQILAGCKQEILVCFEDAIYLFPEYTESYDLIGPAHIFELNIEGEGLRVRQCFEGEVFRPELYEGDFAELLSEGLDRFVDDLIRERDLTTIIALGEQGLIDDERLKRLLTKMTADSWVEGIRTLLVEKPGW